MFERGSGPAKPLGTAGCLVLAAALLGAPRPHKTWAALYATARSGMPPAGVVPSGPDPITGRTATYLITPNMIGDILFHSFSQFNIGHGETATFTEWRSRLPIPVALRPGG